MNINELNDLIYQRSRGETEEEKMARTIAALDELAMRLESVIPSVRHFMYGFKDKQGNLGEEYTSLADANQELARRIKLQALELRKQLLQR